MSSLLILLTFKFLCVIIYLELKHELQDAENQHADLLEKLYHNSELYKELKDLTSK